jgi:transcriptional activator HAC1
MSRHDCAIPKHTNCTRKRAKTEDEKEQRRVERVLRNRRAAQSSRERKRLEVEALEEQKKAIERRNSDLEMRLAKMMAENADLTRQLAQATGSSPQPFASLPHRSGTEQSTQHSPITFSQELFGSQDQPSPFRPNVLEAHAKLQSNIQQSSLQTVNPASISPAMRPVSDSNASSTDMSQHSAVVLSGLQCQSVEQRPWMTSLNPALSAQLILLSMISLTCSTILTPLAQIMNTLRTGSYLSPTPSVLNIIIWLATTTTSLTTLTLNNISTTIAKPLNMLRPRFSLRLDLVRQLLTSNPHMARPLMDATMSVLRLAIDHQIPSRYCLAGQLDASKSDVGYSSRESLITLLWTVKVVARKNFRSCQPSLETKLMEVIKGIEPTVDACQISNDPPPAYSFEDEARRSTMGLDDEPIIKNQISSIDFDCIKKPLFEADVDFENIPRRLARD